MMDLDRPVDPTVERLRVSLGARGYDIFVGPGLLNRAGEYLGPLLQRPRTVVITDENVRQKHFAKLAGSLDDAGIETSVIVIPPGEGSKNFSQLEQVLDQLLDTNIERGDTLIALGGGVVGDLAGFAASVLRRGVGIIQMPTTLLAQVDSSVGGKTGINTRQGKNLVGTFHQPRLVLADTSVLDTLLERELRAGYAEIVKTALIGDATFFSWLEDHGQDVLASDDPSVTSAARNLAIVTSCRAKASIVADDEHESGDRALLNLGHTFGHALEAEAGFDGSLLHGEAVAAGLVLAFQLSAQLGFCAEKDAVRIAAHLRYLGLAASIAELGLDTDPAKLWAHMSQDKKSRGGVIPFILARGIGEAFISDKPTESDIAAVLGQTV
jgi:3-dehydroquinate synthase